MKLETITEAETIILARCPGTHPSISRQYGFYVVSILSVPWNGKRPALGVHADLTEAVLMAIDEHTGEVMEKVLSGVQRDMRNSLGYLMASAAPSVN